MNQPWNDLERRMMLFGPERKQVTKTELAAARRKVADLLARLADLDRFMAESSIWRGVCSK